MTREEAITMIELFKDAIYLGNAQRKSEALNMADIELVIKIDKETYTHLLARYKYQNTNDIELDDNAKVGVAIKNGTPLPKGHGDLIDRDKLEIEEIGDVNCYSIRQIDDAVAVVKADRGDVDGNS